MELDERQKKILSVIVESFIETAEPVGSRTIARMGKLNVSPATIRNEMADLEDLGLLEQPHTSARRVPSHKGYRLYVHRLIAEYKPRPEDISRMKILMGLKVAQLDILIKEIIDIYSKLTKYTLIGTTPERKKGYIKHFQLMQAGQNELLLIIVTNGNIVKDTKIYVGEETGGLDCTKISNILNMHLTGIPCNEINIDIIDKVLEGLAGNKNILRPVLQFIYDCVEANDNAEVFHRGLTNLLGFPEYSDITRARQLLDFLTDKANLQKTITSGEDKKLRVVIGAENKAVELQDCSVVLSSYHVGNEIIGTIGFIGPTRMNYSKVVSNVQFLASQLDKLIQKYLEDAQ